MRKLNLIIIIFSIVIFTGCNAEHINDKNTDVTPVKSVETKTHIETKAPVEYIGNSYGNIVNGGYAAFSNNEIYFIKDETSGDLYKANSDWTRSYKIASSIYPQCINIVDDWIYYSNKREGGIYKIKTDGTGKSKITEDKTESMNVVGEWIFYRNDSEGDYKSNGRLYKIKTDGSEKIKVIDEMTSNISVVNNKIYYLSWVLKENMYVKNLCTINIDGTSQNEILDNCRSFIYGDDNIYYIGYDEKLYKLDIKNNSKSLIMDDRVKEFNIDNKWIYYVKNDGLEEMYKIGVNGGGDILLSSDRTAGIHIVGDWLFYDSVKAEMFADYHRIKLDGTMKSSINEGSKGDGEDTISIDYDNMGSVKADSYYEDEFIRALIRAEIEAVNNDEFSLLEKYIQIDSSAYEYLEKKVKEMNDENTKLEFLDFEVIESNEIEETEKESIKELIVREEFLYKYSDNNGEKKTTTMIYVIKYYKDKDEFKLVNIYKDEH